MTRRLTLGAVMAGVVEVYLAHRSAGPGGILERRYGLLLLIAGWTAASAVAVLCVLRLPRRIGIPVILVVAVAMRVAAVAPKAPLSDDLYRYAWDGIVQTHGIDPYRYPPLAPELTQLRTPWLFPGPARTVINRPHVRTIYPPVAELWFTAEHLVIPLSARDRGYEGAGLLLDLAVLAVLLALLRDRRWLALYALSPLPALEAVANAHVDVLAVLLTLVAIGLAERRRSTAAVVTLALATLTKVYPVLLLPALLRSSRHRSRDAVTFTAACLAAYVPHVLAVGGRIVGYLPGYLREEHYSSGTRYLLLGLLGLRGAPATAVAGLALAAILLWSVRTDRPTRDVTVRVMAGVLLVVTPVQPWYALLLLALATLARDWRVLVLTMAAYPLFFAIVLTGNAVLIGRLSYGLAAVVLVVSGLRRTPNGDTASTAATRRTAAA